MKLCKKCNIEKELDCFYKKKDNKDGLENRCKECNSKRHKNNYKLNKSEISERNKKWKEDNRIYLLEQNKDYYIKNKETISIKKSEYRKANIAKSKIKSKEYYNKNKDKINERKRNKRIENPLDQFKSNIKSSIRRSFNENGFTKNSKTFTILGITFAEFKVYIESKFKEGMSWDNHGVYGWHLDHITPISYAKTIEDVVRLNHYTNFQPLWSFENLSKGNKFIG